MKAIALVVVMGGVAEEYAPEHVDCRIIDLDNITGPGDPIPELPAGMGFEELAERAGLEVGKDVVFV
jgi:hypothetical protein